MALWFAGPPPQDEKRGIHDVEHHEKEQHRGRGEFCHRAQQCERRKDKQQRHNGDVRRARTVVDTTKEAGSRFCCAMP
jgi:hypothetical protein